jgi:hypothetical protein
MASSSHQKTARGPETDKKGQPQKPDGEAFANGASSTQRRRS